MPGVYTSHRWDGLLGYSDTRLGYSTGILGLDWLLGESIGTDGRCLLVKRYILKREKGHALTAATEQWNVRTCTYHYGTQGSYLDGME